MSQTFIIFLFVFLIGLLLAVLFLLNRKRRNVKQASSSVNKFNSDIKNILSKLDNRDDKIKSLLYTLEKINSHKEYNKNITWKNSLLLTVYMYLLPLYYEANDKAKALDICNKILEANPNHGLTYYNRGSLYSDMGKYDEAIQDFNLAEELNPEYANIFNNRGLVYDKLKLYEKAIEDYNQALKMEESAITFFNKANALASLNRIEEALTNYQKYLDLDPNNICGLKDTVNKKIIDQKEN